MKITEYLKTVEKIPAWDRIPAISDEELADILQLRKVMGPDCFQKEMLGL